MRWIFLVNLARLFFRANDVGIRVIVFTFYRSAEDQAAEYAAGRSRTKNGFHPLWLAVDLVIWDDVNGDGIPTKEEIRWKMDPRYYKLGSYWESLGGVWGGRWRDPCDPYHFEWSSKMTE